MKLTSFADMRCSVARTLDQVGPWWSLLVIRDAMMGTRRFSEFQKSLGIAKNTLANRLAELVENGIMERVPSSTGSKYLEYELTEKGRDLAPVVMALAQWGDRWSAHDDGPSFEMLQKGSGDGIKRVWPRDDDGNVIRLSDIVLRRCGAEDEEAQPLASKSGESE